MKFLQQWENCGNGNYILGTEIDNPYETLVTICFNTAGKFFFHF